MKCEYTAISYCDTVGLVVGLVVGLLVGCVDHWGSVKTRSA